MSSAHLVKTPVPGSSQGPQRYHGISIPSIHQLNPLGQGRGQAVIGSAGKSKKKPRNLESSIRLKISRLKI